MNRLLALGFTLALLLVSCGTDSQRVTGSSATTAPLASATTFSSSPSTTTIVPTTTSVPTLPTPPVPTGYQLWDASDFAFTLVIPETWVIEGELDDERKRLARGITGEDPRAVTPEAPMLLAFNPADARDLLFVSVISRIENSDAQSFFEDLEAMDATALAEYEESFQDMGMVDEVTARIVRTAQGHPALHTALTYVSGMRMGTCIISPSGDSEEHFLLVASSGDTREPEWLEVGLGSFMVTDEGRPEEEPPHVEAIVEADSGIRPGAVMSHSPPRTGTCATSRRGMS